MVDLITPFNVEYYIKQYLGVLGTSGEHNILSVAHSDTDIAALHIGDLLVVSDSLKWKPLLGNVTTTKKFLTQIGTGVTAEAPTWEAIKAEDLPTYHYSNKFTVTNPNIKTYILSYIPVEGTLFLFLNGLYLEEDEYIVSGKDITISDSITLTEGDVLTARYEYLP